MCTPVLFDNQLSEFIFRNVVKRSGDIEKSKATVKVRFISHFLDEK